MTVDDLFDWIAKHKDPLIESLLKGDYQPQPVRGIEIPKHGNKGVRLLGVPSPCSAIDSLVGLRFSRRVMVNRQSLYHALIPLSKCLRT
jgi:hypothetical protein